MIVFVRPSAKSLCGLTHVISLACSVDEMILLQITKLTEIKYCTRFHFMSFHKYKHRWPLRQKGSIICQLAHRKIIPWKIRISNYDLVPGWTQKMIKLLYKLFFLSINFCLLERGSQTQSVTPALIHINIPSMNCLVILTHLSFCAQSSPCPIPQLNLHWWHFLSWVASRVADWNSRLRVSLGINDVWTNAKRMN